MVWGIFKGEWVGVQRNVEAYITHNGDLDFLSLHGTIHPLEEVQQILIALLHHPMPASVDSACVAGVSKAAKSNARASRSSPHSSVCFVPHQH